MAAQAHFVVSVGVELSAHNVHIAVPEVEGTVLPVHPGTGREFAHLVEVEEQARLVERLVIYGGQFGVEFDEFYAFRPQVQDGDVVELLIGDAFEDLFVALSGGDVAAVDHAFHAARFRVSNQVRAGTDPVNGGILAGAAVFHVHSGLSRHKCVHQPDAVEFLQIAPAFRRIEDQGGDFGKTPVRRFRPDDLLYERICRVSVEPDVSGEVVAVG